MRTLWVIEKRDADGRLDFSKPQPEEVFGLLAITGITEDQMAKVVYRECDKAGKTDVVMDGQTIARWPGFIDSRFVARRKTW